MSAPGDGRAPSSSQASAARARDWLMVALFMLAYILSGVDRQMLAFVALDIKRDLHISDFEIGLLQGVAFALFYAIAGLPLGWAIDSGPRIRIIGLAMTVWSGMTVLSGFARGFPSLAFGRVGVGVGEAALTPGVYSILGDIFPKRQIGTASLLYSLGAPLSLAVAALVSAFVHGAATGAVMELPLIGPVATWRMAFVIAGAPGLLMAGFIFALREPRRGPSHADDRQGLRLLPYLRTHWRVEGIYAVGATALVCVHYSIAAWSPALLSQALHWTPKAVAVTLGGIGLFGGATGCVLGGLAANWGLRRSRPAAVVGILGVISAGMATVGLALPLIDAGWQAIAALAISGVLTPMALMLIPTVLQVFTPSGLRGRMTAFFMFANIGFGAGVGPALVGWFSSFIFGANHLGISIGVVVMGAGILALISFMFLVVNVHRTYLHKLI